MKRARAVNTVGDLCPSYEELMRMRVDAGLPVVSTKYSKIETRISVTRVLEARSSGFYDKEAKNVDVPVASIIDACLDAAAAGPSDPRNVLLTYLHTNPIASAKDVVLYPKRKKECRADHYCLPGQKAASFMTLKSFSDKEVKVWVIWSSGVPVLIVPVKDCQWKSLEQMDRQYYRHLLAFVLGTCDGVYDAASVVGEAAANVPPGVCESVPGPTGPDSAAPTVAGIEPPSADSDLSFSDADLDFLNFDGDGAVQHADGELRLQSSDLDLPDWMISPL